MSEKLSVAEQITASMNAVLGTMQAQRAAPNLLALEAEVARLNNEVLILTARLTALEAKAS